MRTPVRLCTLVFFSATIVLGACDDDSPATDTDPQDGGTQVDGVDETVLPASSDPETSAVPNPAAGAGERPAPHVVALIS